GDHATGGAGSEENFGAGLGDVLVILGPLDRQRQVGQLGVETPRVEAAVLIKRPAEHSCHCEGGVVPEVGLVSSVSGPRELMEGECLDRRAFRTVRGSGGRGWHAAKLVLTAF